MQRLENGYPVESFKELADRQLRSQDEGIGLVGLVAFSTVIGYTAAG